MRMRLCLLAWLALGLGLPALAENVSPIARKTTNLAPSPEASGGDGVARPIGTKTQQIRQPRIVYVKPEDMNHFWAHSEYFFATTKHFKRPNFPLLSVGPVTVDEVTGHADDPLAERLFNDDKQQVGLVHGFRGRYGAWIDERKRLGAEIAGVWLQDKDRVTTLSFSANPNSDFGGIFIPFVTPRPRAESAFPLMVNRGSESASMTINQRQRVWGAELMGVHNVVRRKHFSIDTKFGVKHFNMTDEYEQEFRRNNLSFVEDPAFPGVPRPLNGLDTGVWFDPDAPTIPGTQLSYVLGSDMRFVDRVEARNRLYAANFAVQFEAEWRKLEIYTQLAGAVGVNFMGMEIEGSSTRVEPSGRTLVYRGGVFAQHSNMGSRKEHRSSGIIELDLKLGYSFTDNLKVYGGYTMYYVSNVMRAGNQFERQITMEQAGWSANGQGQPFGGEVRGPFQRNKTDDWFMHGGTFGIRLEW